MYTQNSITAHSENHLCAFENEMRHEKSIGKIRHTFARLEEIARDFTLVNQYGNFINLYDSLESSPVVINFLAAGIDIKSNAQVIAKLNLFLSILNIKHYVISQDQDYLNLVSNQLRLVNIELLHDPNLYVFHRYGLAEEKKNTPFEQFEKTMFTDNAFNYHVNAMYLIDTDKIIRFSQLNFSEQSIQPQALIEEINTLNLNNKV